MSQREYYQLFAFFNNVDEPTLELATPEQKRLRTDLQGRITALEKRLTALDPVTPQQLEKWEGALTPEARGCPAGADPDHSGHRSQRPQC